MNKSKTKSQKSVGINIEHVAKPANLTLSKEEKDLFQKQLSEILGYVENLNKIDTKNVEPIAHITGLENIGREDVASPSLSQEDAISQAQNVHNGFILSERSLPSDN